MDKTVKSATVLVVDDDPELCENLRALILDWGYETHAATSGAMAMVLARQVRPDVTITDLAMPGLNGLELLSLLKDFDPGMEVIMLTGQGTMETAIAALREGRAFDFLQKPMTDLQHLHLTIERALSRRARRTEASPAEAGPRPVLAEPLTSRELEILGLLQAGHDTRELATRLCLSEKTVRNHLSNIFQKLGASNRLQAVMLAQQAGVI